MPIIRVFSACLLLILFTTGIPSCAKKKTDFRFNLQKGSVYEYAITMDMEQAMGEQKVNTGMNMNYNIEVTEDDGNIKTLKATYGRTVMKMTGQGTSMEIDSDKVVPAEQEGLNMVVDMMSRMFAALKGKSFIMKVNEKGEITEVQGINELADAMLNNSNIPEEQKPAMEQTFKQQFNDETMKQTFAQSFNIFPAKPVAVGDSWEKEASMNMGVAMKMKTTYTVKKIEENTVTLDAQSKISSGNMKMNQTGTMIVDKSTGLVTDATLTQKSEGEMQMETKVRIRGRKL
jgi:FtsP/CotA-like multicopper oxidase with cupredoxin domain